MDISSFPCTQLVFAFSLGWTLKEVNINGDFNQYIWAFSLGWTQETDVRVTSSSLLISSGKPEEVFPTNIFSVLNECPPLSTEPKLFNTIPTQFLLTRKRLTGNSFWEFMYLKCLFQLTDIQPVRFAKGLVNIRKRMYQISMTRSWRCSAVTSDATNISSQRRREIVHPPKEHEVLQMALEKTGVT